MRKLFPILLGLLAILHQDFWFWNEIHPLVFGFVPIGLAYHVGVSIAAAVLWAVAVYSCWPQDVDVPDAWLGGSPGDSIQRCHQCDRVNPLHAQYCGRCGAALAARSQTC